MEPLTVLVVLAIIVAWIWMRGREQQKKESQEDQFELRYPTLYEYEASPFFGRVFVDFEQMLLVDETTDIGFQHVRVFHLRRKDGPLWEICEEADSRTRSWSHNEARKKMGRLPLDEEEERYLRNPTLWRQINYPTLESVYQRFLLHYRPSMVFKVSPVVLAVEGDFVEGTPRPSRKWEKG